MSTDLMSTFRAIKFNYRDWRFSDLRIAIPPMSFGSDAANPHTQYSNAVALCEADDLVGIGISFTLGEGNDMLCRAAEFMVAELNGLTVADLIDSPSGFYETLVNPRQLRWLSPYAGIPMMAAGLIVNALTDLASKRCEMAAWEFLAKLPTKDLLSLMSFTHIERLVSKSEATQMLDDSFPSVDERCQELKERGLPVYFTTWIGHSAQEISKQIIDQSEMRGIKKFKLKVSPDIQSDLNKLDAVQASIPSNFQIAVDANQTLTFNQAHEWLRELSNRSMIWLEEPFAPDNLSNFSQLGAIRQKENLSCEIATGENCPNAHTAFTLMRDGLNRFQSDPCRMLGLIDGLLTAMSSKKYSCHYTPHAGGTGLDELAPHLQLLNLARVDSEIDPLSTLTENVGFCSKFYAQPTKVTAGKALTPTQPGLMVGFETSVHDKLFDYKDGTTWLEL